MRNAYCMFKGKLICGAPYSDAYIGSPHYVITVGKDDGTTFNVVGVEFRIDGACCEWRQSSLHLHRPQFRRPNLRQAESTVGGVVYQRLPRSSIIGRTAACSISAACGRSLTRTRPAPASTSTMRSTISSRSMKIRLLNSVPITMVGTHRIARFRRPSGQGDVTVHGFGFLLHRARRVA